jgi:hypothetical protein
MANVGAAGSPDQQALQSGPAAIASGLVSGNNSTALAAAALAQQLPTIGQYGFAGAVAGQELGLVGPQLAVTGAEAQNQTGYDLANALLGYEGIGLQSQGLAQQASTAAAQQGLEQAQFGVSQTQYPEQQAEAALQNQNAVINQRDSAAISGTINTQGSKRDVATQAQEYAWQQADIFRNQQLAQLGQQSEQVGYQGQQSQFANQQQQLALAAQGEGLTAQQAQAQLGFGLQQAGISAKGDALSYLQQMAADQGQQAGAFGAGLSAASLYGGLGPNFGYGVLQGGS